VKLITAVIKSDDVEQTKESLKEAGITGLTVSEARGFGRRGGTVELYRGSEHVVDLMPRFRLEVVVPDRAAVERVVNALAVAARAAGAPEGKVWVTDVEWVVSLRTGEMNDEAL
jgi:nitrogen regulatory protein P-II 1